MTRLALRRVRSRLGHAASCSARAAPVHLVAQGVSSSSRPWWPDRPRALSKDELHDLLWPETPSSWKRTWPTSSASIRAALGDDAQPAALRPDRPPLRLRLRGRGGARQCRHAPAPASGTALPAHRGRAAGPSLAQGEHVLGREPGLAISLDSTTVSRRHARIRVEGDEATIEDLGSKNGTLLNDQTGRRAAAARGRRPDPRRHRGPHVPDPSLRRQHPDRGFPGRGRSLTDP